MKRIKPKLSRLRKKGKKGLRGFPAVTVALYGPSDKLATKIPAMPVLGRAGPNPVSDGIKAIGRRVFGIPRLLGS